MDAWRQVGKAEPSKSKPADRDTYLSSRERRIPFDQLPTVLESLLQRSNSDAFINSRAEAPSGSQFGIGMLGSTTQPLQVTVFKGQFREEDRSLLDEILAFLTEAGIPHQVDPDTIYIEFDRDTAKAAQVTERIYQQVLRIPAGLYLTIEEN